MKTFIKCHQFVKIIILVDFPVLLKLIFKYRLEIDNMKLKIVSLFISLSFPETGFTLYVNEVIKKAIQILFSEWLFVGIMLLALKEKF
jgi:hypothetical protein